MKCWGCHGASSLDELTNWNLGSRVTPLDELILIIQYSRTSMIETGPPDEISTALGQFPVDCVAARRRWNQIHWVVSIYIGSNGRLRYEIIKLALNIVSINPSCSELTGPQIHCNLKPAYHGPSEFCWLNSNIIRTVGWVNFNFCAWIHRFPLHSTFQWGSLKLKLEN
jgi:hypothetical protein